MNVRVYLNPKKFELHTNPHGARHILVDGIKQHVHEGGGFIYFEANLLAPMSSTLRKSVVSVTYHTVITDGDQIDKITRGHYAHGRFEATAILKIAKGDPFDYKTLEIMAKAPTAQGLKHWLRLLLVGKDTPVELYSPAPKSQTEEIEITRV